MPDQNLEVLRKESYLRMIENASGTRMFASLFVRRKDDGIVTDVLNDGEYSCAAFVSSVLVLNGILDRPCATVASLQKAMVEQGWTEAQDGPRPGDVLVWAEHAEQDGSMHGHIGFAIGENEAVSTSTKEKQVARHHRTFGTKDDGSPARAIVATYRRP